MASNLIVGGQPLGAGTCQGTLADAGLVDTLAAYRRRIAGNYRALPLEEIDKIPQLTECGIEIVYFRTTGAVCPTLLPPP